MSAQEFDAVTAAADSEAVIPGSPARFRIDERLRAARSIRASLRPPATTLSRFPVEPAAPRRGPAASPSLQND